MTTGLPTVWVATGCEFACARISLREAAFAEIIEDLVLMTASCL